MSEVFKFSFLFFFQFFSELISIEDCVCGGGEGCIKIKELSLYIPQLSLLCTLPPPQVQHTG